MSWRKRLLWLPPPVITGLAGVLMWLSERGRSELPWRLMDQSWLTLGAGLAVGLVGLLLMVLSAHTMRRANTTLLPFVPQLASALVTQGLFRYSRNPIYVGDALLLMAWVIWLGTAINLLWLALFVLYMTKVQIAAEEQALQNKFGDAYQAYCQAVRRWL